MNSSTRGGWLLVGLLLLAAPAVAQANDRVGPRAIQAATAGVGRADTLKVWNRPVVVFRAPYGTMSPAQRVENAAKRIEAVPETAWRGEVKAQAYQLGDLEGMLVMVDSQPMFGLLPADVDVLSGETLPEAAEAAAGRLREALQARHDQRSVPLLVRGVLRLLAGTFLFAFIVWLVRRTFNAASRRLETSGRLAQFKVFNIDFKPHAVTLGRRGLSLLAWAAILAGGYLWLTFDLAQFPYSRPWAEALAAWLRGILGQLLGGIVGALPGLAMVAIIFLITRAVARLATGVFREVELGSLTIRGIHPETARASRQVLVVLLWLFAVTVAYPYIPGSQTDAFKGVSLFAGLVFSLGSAGLLNQVMSGLVVTYSRAIRIGEYVRVGELEGVVTDLGVLCTRIVTRKREEIAIPNAVLVSSTTTNYSRLAGPDGATLSTSVTIGYAAPWRQVHALLLLAAARTPGVRKSPPPRILQKALSDFFVEYALLFNIDRAEERLVVLSDLHGQIQDAFNESGVQIMSPHFEAQPEGPVLAPEGKWSGPPRKPDETQEQAAS